MESCLRDQVPGSRILLTSILSNEIWHGQDAAHPAGVIAKENAAKGSKGADEVGLDSDGGFDTGCIGGPSDHNTSSRHGCGFTILYTGSVLKGGVKTRRPGVAVNMRNELAVEVGRRRNFIK